jgi:hypothetical protein
MSEPPIPAAEHLRAAENGAFPMCRGPAFVTVYSTKAQVKRVPAQKISGAPFFSEKAEILSRFALFLAAIRDKLLYYHSLEVRLWSAAKPILI